MSKLKGRKVKILCNSIWHMSEQGATNTATIGEQHDEGVTVTDGYGVIFWLPYNEVAYLNGKPVKPVDTTHPLVGKRVMVCSVSWFNGMVGTVCDVETDSIWPVQLTFYGHDRRPWFKLNELRYLNNRKVDNAN